MSRKWTEEERKQFGERMKELKQAKQKSQTQQKTDKKDTVEISADQLKALLARLDNLEHNVPPTYVQPSQPQFDARGRLVGVQQEFSTKFSDYTSPVEQLLKEPEFLQFGLAQNYELIWSIKPVNWEGKDGLKHVEPRFELELNMYLRDEDNQLIKNDNGTYKAIAFRKGMFFEDKEAAEYAAHDMGLDFSAPDIYDRLRYQAFKQWLLGIFTPPRPVDQGNHQRTEIFNNQEFRVIDSIKQEIM